MKGSIAKKAYFTAIALLISSAIYASNENEDLQDIYITAGSNSSVKLEVPFGNRQADRFVNRRQDQLIGRGRPGDWVEVTLKGYQLGFVQLREGFKARYSHPDETGDSAVTLEVEHETPKAYEEGKSHFKIKAVVVHWKSLELLNRF